MVRVSLAASYVGRARRTKLEIQVLRYPARSRNLSNLFPGGWRYEGLQIPSVIKRKFTAVRGCLT